MSMYTFNSFHLSRTPPATRPEKLVVTALDRLIIKSSRSLAFRPKTVHKTFRNMNQLFILIRTGRTPVIMSNHSDQSQ